MDLTDGAPDELARLLADEPGSGGDNNPNPPGQGGGNGDVHGDPASGESQANKLLAGRFKTPADLEKSYLSLRKGLTTTSSRLKSIEDIVKNPKFHEWAKKDPAIREALGKAGISLAEAEEEVANQGGDGHEWDGNPNDPRYIAETVREENRLNWEFFRFERKLGRDITDPERASIFTVLRSVPDLTVDQAWKLTPEYESSIKTAQEKALDEAKKKFSPKARPAPTPVRFPSQKLDMKKPVSEMNEQERASFLADIMNRAPQ